MTLTQPVAIEQPDSVPLSQKPPMEEIEPAQPSLSQTDSKPTWTFWTVFSSTFLTIFFAEMGDKTQLATLLISAESQSPWVVFAGAAIALMATSLLGVLMGYWIARRLSPKTLDLVVALLLLLITGLLIGDVIVS
jgi:putative Ca2+/H+ antiporter (TMEM165/GDT1 family)